MSPKHRSNWSRPAKILILLTLTSALIRFYRLDAQSFWGDEALSALIAASNLSEIWNNVFGSTHPEGYYILLHFWIRVAGRSDFALRYLSAWWGVLSIVLTYQLGRNIRSRRLGLWAAGITTVTPYHVFYSQETRMYMLLYSLTCIIMLAYIQLWRDRKKYYWWIIYVVASMAGLWTHFFAGFVLCALAIHFLVLRLWSGFEIDVSCLGWYGFIIANGAIGVAFILYIPHFIPRLQIVRGWRSSPSLSDLVGLPLTFTVSNFSSGTWQMVTLGSVTFLLIVVGLQVARALRYGFPASKSLLLLSLLLLVPVTVSFIISHVWKPIFAARVLTIVVPALYLLIAWSALHTRERRFNQIILALLLPQMLFGLHNWFFNPAYSKPPIRDAARLVRDSELAKEPVFHAIAESYMVFEHYASSIDNCLLTDPAQPRVGKRIDPEDISNRRFWFVFLPTYAYESQIELRDSLDARFGRQQEWNVGGIKLYHYVSFK